MTTIQGGAQAQRRRTPSPPDHVRALANGLCVLTGLVATGVAIAGIVLALQSPDPSNTVNPMHPHQAAGLLLVVGAVVLGGLLMGLFRVLHDLVDVLDPAPGPTDEPPSPPPGP